MALAETTVVETVSEGWRRSCPGYRCLRSASSQCGQEPNGCDDEKRVTMGEGDCRAGQDLLATCHGVSMGMDGCVPMRGPVQGSFVVAIRDITNPTGGVRNPV